jgi:hypothetical protein
MNPKNTYIGQRVQCKLDGRVGRVTAVLPGDKTTILVLTDRVRGYAGWQLEPYDLPKLEPFHLLPWRFREEGGDHEWARLSEDDRQLYQAYALCNVLHVPTEGQADRLTARAKELGLDVEVTWGDHRSVGIRPKNAWGGRNPAETEGARSLKNILVARATQDIKAGDDVALVMDDHGMTYVEPIPDDSGRCRLDVQ